MINKLFLLITFLTCALLQFEKVGKPKNDFMNDTGNFIMMPDKQQSSFKLDLERQQLIIDQNNTSIIILLEQAINYEDTYAAPKGKQLIKQKSKVLHISKNVFNNDPAVEVLIQLAYKLQTDQPEEFVLDLVVSENGSVTLLGSTYWRGTGMESHPVFAIIDGKAYYGIYDDRYHGLIDEPVGKFLKAHQQLNGPPYTMDSGFTNGTISYVKSSWEYSKKEGIPIKDAIQSKQNFLKRLIGNKEDSLIVNHSIQYYGRDYKPSDRVEVKVKVVATFNDEDYNPRGIRSLISDLGKCSEIQIIPLLMYYLEDDRSLDLPGDDYGETTISRLAENALSKILRKHPDLFINYRERFVSYNLLTTWWSQNKQFYK